MNKRKRIGRMVLCLIISFVMVMTLIPRMPAGLAFAAEGDEQLPTNPTKARASNNNGTYKIELSITGDAQTNTDATKANVIIIMDTSGSMADDAPTANTSPTGRYGYRDESYINLYTRNANGTYSQVTNNTTEGPVYYRTGNYQYYEYTTTRYTSNQGESTRLAQTKTAVNSLIDTLLAQNQNISDMIEIAYMTFGSSAAYRTPGSATGTGWVSGTNGTTLKNTVSTTNVNTGQQAGTNWDDALHDAKALADAKTDGDKTYIVFFTDGEPTFNNGGVNAQGNHNHGNSQQGGGNHTTNADIESAEYEAALLNSDNYDLYGIFAYGDPENYNYMTRVLTKGNGSADGFGFYADNQSSLNEAFAAIASAVSAAVGVEQVTLSDGTTSSVTQTSGTISHLLSVDESSYEYWMTWTVAQNGTFEMFQNGKTTTYTATQNGNNIVITWTENGEAKTVTYEGTKNGNVIKIKWDRATEFYNYAPPEAEFENDAVNWDLSEVGEKGTLLDGVTYSYSFDVYPAQDTYDIIAQLKNHEIEYDSLDENIQKYIKPDGHGGYTLETNTAATYSYYDAITETTHQGTMDNPPAVTTDASQMTIKKTWENSIDDYDKEPLNMSIMQKTGSEVINYGTVALNDGNDYQNSIYIATGLLTTTKDAQGNVTDIKVLDTGHDYYMAEPVGVSYHWDLIAETVHPMLIDGVLTTLVKVDEPSGMAGKNYYKEGNTEYYRLTDGVYKAKESGATVSAENKRRNTLLLTKELDANGFDIPEGTRFTFDMTVDNNIDNPSADDEDVWFAVYKKGTTSFETNNIVFDDTIVTGAEKEIATIDTTRTDTVSADNVVSVDGDHLTYTYGGNQYTVKIASAEDGSYTYYVYEVIGIDEDAGTVTYTRYGTEATAPYEGMDGNNPKYWTGFWHAPSGTANIKAELEEGQIVRYTNLPIGSTYTFVEEEPTDGFAYEKAEATVKTGSAGSEGTDPNATVTDAQRKVEGTMNVGNSIYKTTYTNNMEKVDITATKVWEDNDNQDGLRTAVTLHLNKSVDGETPTVVTGQDKTIPEGATGDALTVTWEDLSTVENGKTVTYSVTEDEIDGYTTEITKDENGANAYIVTNTHTPETVEKVATKEWVDKDNVNNTRPSSITFNLMKKVRDGEATKVMSVTLDGTAETAPTGTDVDGYESAAWEATFVNLPKYEGGTEITYSVTEDAVEGYTTNIDGLNVKNTYNYGSLDISKTVDSGNGDTSLTSNKEFTFTVNLYKDSTKAETVEGTFNYTITPAEADASTGTIASGGTVKLKDGQTVSIADLPIGTYYEVTEAAEDGYTTTKTGDTGTIASSTTSTAAFTNTYSAEPAKAQIPVVKNVTPEDSGAADITGKFTFTLAADTNTAGEGVTTPMPTSDTVLCGADGVEVKFGEITFNAPGTYTYTVTESETDGAVGGITLDTDKPRTITVVVTDDGEGTLTAVVNGGSTVSFNNPYSMTSLDITIPVEKELVIPEGLTGPDITNKYTFTIATTNDAPLPENKVIEGPSGAAGGSMTFGQESTTGKITITEPGIYTYTITESGTVAGVENDETATKTVTVTVVNNGDGTMSYTINNAEDKTDDVTKFTNTYSADPVKASIPVEKVLTGDNAPNIQGKYTFTIADDTTDEVSSPLPETKSYDNPDEDGGVVTFGEIEYKAPGKYVYVITESGTVEGVVNDANATTGKTVRVEIEDGREGKLVVKSISSTTDSPLQFTNTYHETAITIPVYKTLAKNPTTLEGPDITGKYTFSIAGSTGAPLPETKSVTNNGAMQFGPITFNEPGEYTYTVTESGEVQGVTNDPDAKTVTVSVTRNEETGELAAAFADGSATSFDFTNTYTVESTTASFPVTKEMSVTGLGPKSWSYTIDVTANGNAPEAANMTGTVTNTAPTVTFGDFTFTEPGEYIYTVTETGTIAGVTNDPAATAGKTVKITVTDNKDGTLTAEANSTTANPLTFTNTYTYNSTTATIQVHKDLVAENPKVSLPDITGEYTFTLADDTSDEVDSPMPASGGETVTNPAKDGGTAEFGTITFNAPGTYTYVVTESGSVTNVTNDPAATTGKIVTVTVVDGQEGELVATVTYPDPEKAEVDFTNTYKADPATVSFPVKKDLKVPDNLKGPETWSYTINVAANGTAPSATTMTGTVTNEKDTVTFGPFSFTDPGEYTYTVSETGTIAGVENDKEAAGKTVTVNVVDNGNGTLSATASSTDGSPLTFTNTYGVTPKPVETKAYLTKAVGFMPPGVDSVDFKFTLEETTADVVTPVKNATVTATESNKDYQIDFGVLTFTEPGEHTYTLTEVMDGMDPGWTVTGSPATTVKIVVTDNGDGTLNAEVTGATITNTFETVTVAGKKTWNDEKYQDLDEDVSEYERPEITIKLSGKVTTEDGEEKEVITKEVTLDGTPDTEPAAGEVVGYEPEAWAFKFVNLPKNYKGEEIVYTLEELDADGFTSVITGYNVANTPDETKTVNNSETALTIKKVDAATGHETGISGAVFTLYDSEGEALDTYTTGSDGTVTIGFDGYTTDEDVDQAVTSTYTLKETEAPEGYELNTTEYTITVKEDLVSVKLNSDNVWEWLYNLITTASPDFKDGVLTVSDTPIKTQITVDKTWNDANDQDGIRPDSLTYTLTGMAGDATAFTDTVTVDVAADGSASKTWTNLATYYDGTKIEYAVTEAAVSGYTTQVGALTEVKDEEGNVTGYTVAVTNTHEVKKTTVTVNKAWEDFENKYETETPITVQLKADGENYGAPVTISERNNWTYTWTDLEFNQRKEAATAETAPVVYTVVESPVDGYETAYGEVTKAANDTYSVAVTNTLQNYEVTVTKEFEGLTVKRLPANFQITATYEGPDGEVTKILRLTDEAAEVSEDKMTYSWKITGVPFGAEVSVTESGADVIGYELTSTMPEPIRVTSDNTKNILEVKNVYTPNFGDLKINKTLELFDKTAGETTFVFSVIAKVGETTVYDNVVSLNYTATDPATKSIEIKGKIPVGATVEVKEIYTSGSYEVVGSDTVSDITIVKGEAAEANFTNTYNDNINQGYGILNEYTTADGTEWAHN